MTDNEKDLGRAIKAAERQAKAHPDKVWLVLWPNKCGHHAVVQEGTPWQDHLCHYVWPIRKVYMSDAGPVVMSVDNLHPF